MLSQRAARLNAVTHAILEEASSKVNTELTFETHTNIFNRAAVSTLILETLHEYPKLHTGSVVNLRNSIGTRLQSAAMKYVRRHPDVFTNDAAFLPARFMLVTEGLCGRRTLGEKQPVYTDAQDAAFAQALRMIRTGKLNGFTGRPMFVSGMYNYQLAVEMMIYDPNMLPHQEHIERHLVNKLNSRTLMIEADTARLTRVRDKIGQAHRLRERLLSQVWLEALLPADEYRQVKDLPLAILLPMYEHLIPTDVTQFAHLVPAGSDVPYVEASLPV